jgi:hypothetical protein
MNGLTLVSIVSAATFFFATIMSLNLAVAIHRRTKKSFVVDNLVIILLLLAVESAIAFSYGIHGAFGGLDERARYFLANSAYSAQISAIAVIVYFILSATRRLIRENLEFSDAPALHKDR